MDTEHEKLSRDLIVAQAMLSELEHYLGQDTLFWSMTGSGMPKLTLGGLLLRLWRLRHLGDLLPPEERSAAREAVSQFEQIVSQNVVRTEARAHEELAARVRQWSAHLRDMRQDVAPSFYNSAVEVRAIIAHLVAQMKEAPFNLEDRWPQQAALLDQQLSERWQTGEFVWPSEWAEAYPKSNFWWLYGLPRVDSK